MSSALSPLQVFVVPGWIYRSAVRNKLGARDLMDYSKLRSILAVDDMAEWFYLNDKFKIQNCLLSTAMLDYNWHSITDAQRAEVLHSVLPLSGSEEIALSANNKLTGSYPMSSCEYQFITIENIVYVVLSEGFMTKVQNNEYKLDFVKNYLRECYAVAAVHDVARFSIFDLYLKQLAN